MRVLMVHNHYKVRGGEDESTEVEERMLRSRGCEVESYRETNDGITAGSVLSVAARTIWSSDSYKRIRSKLRSSKFDVVHVQNFFPLISPAVYYAAKAEGVPVVQMLRNYRLLCPNGLFFRDQRPCEDCLGKTVPLSGIAHACYRGSRPATAAVTAMIVAHRAFRTWSEKVDVYIALTQFARAKFVEGGLPENKIVVKPNFVFPDPSVGEGGGCYALFAGRLSEEKGLDTLLTAWQRIGNSLPLKIAGDGPLRTFVMERARSTPGVEYVGHHSPGKVMSLIKEAAILVFPSKLYEGMPRIIIESFAVGTPVVASKIGSMIDMVRHANTGLHFLPSNPEDLAEKIEWVCEHPNELVGMRRAARAEYEREYTAERNFELILEIYRRARTYA